MPKDRHTDEQSNSGSKQKAPTEPLSFIKGDLRQSEDRFARIFAHNAAVMSLVRLADGTYLDVNGEWTRVLGYPRKDVVGKTELQLGLCTDADAYDAMYRTLREIGFVRDLELSMRRASGAICVLLLSAQVIEMSGEHVILCSAVNITERKRTEEALRASEEKYRTLFEKFDEGYCLVEIIRDASGHPVDMRYLEVNSVFERQTGLHGVAGKTHADLGMKIERHWFEKYWEVARTGIAARFESYHQPSQRWYNVFVSRADDRHGDRVALVFSDATEQKLTEEALREGELRYREMYEEMRALFAAMTDLVFIFNSEGQYLKIVDTSPSLLYKPSNELLGKTLHEIFPKEQADFFLSRLMHALSTQQSVNFEYILFIGDEEYWFNATVSPISKEKIMMVARDITQRKQAEETLRESEKKFRTVFEQAAIGIGRVSFDDARWIEVNDTFCRMLGYTRDELTCIPWTQITYPEDVELDLVPFRRMATGELESYSVEKRFIHKQGHHVWARLTLSLVRDAKGRPDYEIAIIEDINQRKQSEDALRQFTEKLEEMVAERSALAVAKTKQLQTLAIELIETEERERRQFAQLLHDDLQQMLAAAKMQVQVVAENRGPEPMLSSAVQLLEESIAKSRRLSHQLSPVILHQAGLIASLEWLSRQMKEQFGLLVDLQLNTSLLMERTPQKVFLFRAVQELLFNIIKHAGVKKAQVEVTGSDDSINVKVSDQGSGFDPQILEKRTGSLGLGLLTIKERTSHIGGTFTIESIPGQGSLFTLTVPSAAANGHADMPAALSAAEEESGKPPRPKATRSSTDRTRVLFVDDHQVMRQGLIKLVTGQPAIQVVGQASNGREALEQARKLTPDVIVMDISMPEMDGIEASRCIKAEFPDVRIIGLTMHNDPQLITSMQNAGAEVTLSKTTSASELVKVIYGSPLGVD